MDAISGLDIVCFANDWGGDPLSKMHLMRKAARRHRVLWVNSLGNRPARATGRDAARIGRRLVAAFAGVREVEPNLHVLSPLALPPGPGRWPEAINGPLVTAQVRGAMKQLGFVRPIVFAYLPAAAPVVDRLGARACVYHCVDDFPAFDGAGEPIAALERELVRKSDVVVCSAGVLAERLSHLHPHVEVVQHGVDVEHFQRALSADLELHPLVAGLPRPIIGFVGLVAEWVDQALIEAVARRHPEGSVVIVGRVEGRADRLRACPNVHLVGRQPYADLPAIVKGFDVALVPFKEGALAYAANPLKAREYLAAGLPVVSTPIPEVERLGRCRVASGAEAFVAEVDAALADPGPSRARAAASRDESWDARWADLSAIVRRLLDEQEAQRTA